MVAKKKLKMKSVNYFISARDVDISSSDYLARLRSNLLSSEFKLYYNGLSPRTANENSIALCREELAVIMYKQDINGTKGPRNLAVILPRISEGGTRAIFKPPSTDGLLECYRIGELKDITVLVNRPPVWNGAMGAHVLNFHGRVTKASIKNFQLVSSNNDSGVLLQFGRVGDNEFSMDLKHPLTPLQAFGICLSSFGSMF